MNLLHKLRAEILNDCWVGKESELFIDECGQAWERVFCEKCGDFVYYDEGRRIAEFLKTKRLKRALRR